MTDNNSTKISQLSVASTLDGSELIPLVQSSVTKSATVSAIAAAGNVGALNDVSVSAVAEGDVLFYVSANAEWHNRQIDASDISGLGTYLTSASASTTYALIAHNHAATSITGLDIYLTSASASTAYASIAHNHAATSITGLDIYLTSASASTTYALIAHNHAAASITGLDIYLTSASASATYTSINHSHTVAALTDVSISSATDNQVLAWSSAGNEWLNRQLIAADISDIDTYLTSASASTTYAQLNHTHVLASITDSGALAAHDTLASASDYGLVLTSVSASAMYQPIGDYITSTAAHTAFATVAHTHAIVSLSDVSISSLSDGQILKWDSVQSQWLNVADEGGITTLTSASDVSLASAVEGDQLIYNSAAGEWRNGGGLISVNTTVNVPSDFSTITSALSDIADKRIASGVEYTINVSVGEHDEGTTGGLSFDHPDGERITLQGEGFNTITSIGQFVTASGAANAWFVNLSVADSTGFAVGDYVSIIDTVGTGNHQNHRGTWEVTAVDEGGSNRIKVSNNNDDSAFPTNTLTGGVVQKYDTVVDFSNVGATTALTLTNGRAINIQDICFIDGGANGLNLSNGARVAANRVAFNGFTGTQINVTTGSLLTGSDIHACNGVATGVLFRSGSTISSARIISSSNGSTGIQIDVGSNSNANPSTACGNGIHGLFVRDGVTYSGLSGFFLNNGNAGITTEDNCTADLTSSTSEDNGVNDVVANRRAYVNFASGTATNFSPAVNTVGNEEAYINT
jgi:hypothetical protein